MNTDGDGPPPEPNPLAKLAKRWQEIWRDTTDQRTIPGVDAEFLKNLNNPPEPTAQEAFEKMLEGLRREPADELRREYLAYREMPRETDAEDNAAEKEYYRISRRYTELIRNGELHGPNASDPLRDPDVQMSIIGEPSPFWPRMWPRLAIASVLAALAWCFFV